ncbi:MAG: hypothetical protein K2I22_17130 [Lachnospiraceae bacterium]|nr:hypothetical protein [Lachnospiraceae bacterium]
MAIDTRTEARTVAKQQPAKKKTKGAALKASILIVLMMALIIGYYYYLSNRDKAKREESKEMTVVQELIARDLTRNYPPTVREVIRFYSEITKCFYNEDYDSDELELLAAQARRLYDDELNENNEWGSYIIGLKKDISYFEENSIRITSYSVPASTDVEFFQDSGYEFARFYCTYYLTNGSSKQTVEEVYLLRKDEAGHWRIYGWDLAENVHPE